MMDDGRQVPAADAATESSSQSDSPKSEREVGEAVRDLVKWLYTNNPFYVLSAWLVFFGLRSSFDTTGDTFQTTALMIGLTVYTVLLAVSACFLVRIGKVWDDVRSMLVLVVLMLLAISVCFDDTLASNPSVGTFYCLTGLVFSVLVSEGLLFGMPLRLPAGFRVPYYLLLTLFFLYPIALSPLFYEPNAPKLQWGLFSFSTVAGLLLLTLLPAVRRGPEYVRDNGSPWPWPWYPWILFCTLALGVLGRAYYLCISLHFVGDGTNIFGTYFWVPFLLALNVLFLEIAIVSRRSVALRIALAAPVVTLLAAIAGESTLLANLRFPERFAETLGGAPLFLTLIATTAFYALCTLRRVPHAVDALSICLVLFSVCGPATANPGTAALTSPRGFPFVFIAVIQFCMAIRQRNAVRSVLSVACVLVAATISYQETHFTAYGGLIPFHLLLAVVLLVGAVVRDKFGEFVQYIGAILIALAGVTSVVCGPRILGEVPPMLPEVYPLLAIATAVAYGYFVRNRSYYLSATGVLVVWLATVAWHMYRGLRQTMAGLDYLLFGLLFFLIAMLISLNKAGVLTHWFRPRRSKSADVEDGPAA